MKLMRFQSIAPLPGSATQPRTARANMHVIHHGPWQREGGVESTMRASLGIRNLKPQKNYMYIQVYVTNFLKK